MRVLPEIDIPFDGQEVVRRGQEIVKRFNLRAGGLALGLSGVLVASCSNSAENVEFPEEVLVEICDIDDGTIVTIPANEMNELNEYGKPKYTRRLDDCGKGDPTYVCDAITGEVILVKNSDRRNSPNRFVELGTPRADRLCSIPKTAP